MSDDIIVKCGDGGISFPLCNLAVTIPLGNHLLLVKSS